MALSMLRGKESVFLPVTLPSVTFLGGCFGWYFGLVGCFMVASCGVVVVAA
jgi:hypothetical protein